MKRHKFKREQIRSVRGPRVSKEDHEFVVRFAAKCMRELSKKDHGLPLLYAAMMVRTKSTHQRSNGGWFGITIDVFGSLNPNGRTYKRFEEYKAIRNQHVFRTIEGDPRLHLKAIIAHEVAHHVQRRYCEWQLFPRRADFAKSHGRGWRQLYAVLRRTLINPYIPDKGTQS